MPSENVSDGLNGGFALTLYFNTIVYQKNNHDKSAVK